MRARLTSWSALGVSARRRKLLSVVVAAGGVAAIYYAGVAMHRARVADAAEQVRREWRDIEETRTASRYGDVKVPLKGDICTSYAFDNWRGGFVGERVTECEPTANPPPRSTASDSTVDSVSRLHGVAAAFKRQQ